MRVDLLLEAGGETLTATVPYAGAAHVEVDAECPHCHVKPLHVAGVRGTEEEGFDTITAKAGCVGCRGLLGKLVVTMSTVFGIEEDRRVTEHSRCRVY